MRKGREVTVTAAATEDWRQREGALGRSPRIGEYMLWNDGIGVGKPRCSDTE